MVDDQRFASYRPDVLVYETEPLDQDITIAGPISPKLKIASSATDSDFDVKLIDVYPENYPDPDDSLNGNKRILDAPPLHMGGYQQLLRGEPFRAKFRNSWEKPEPLIPGKEADLNFTMPDLFHTFRARPSHHDSGAEFLVPAHRPQSADIHRHSQRQTVMIFRRPPNRSCVRKMRRPESKFWSCRKADGSDAAFCHISAVAPADTPDNGSFGQILLNAGPS